MCGRCVLTLGRCDVVGACAYKRRGESKYRVPEWIEGETLGRQYSPSTNVAPTDIVPVLKQCTDDDRDYVVESMLWGMVPPWHKGSHKSHGLQTNNCRIETISTSKLFGEPLRAGKRCAVLAEGFYEWKTVDKSKTPHFIFATQAESVKVYDPNTWRNSFDEDEGWKGIRLLKMAALYNSWKGEEGTLKSYSIITMESNEIMNRLHHRMPAILESDEQMTNWLDVKNVTHCDALTFLKPATQLDYYAVSTKVNNSRNKDKDCNVPFVMEDAKSSKSNPSKKFMENWLKRQSPVKMKIEPEDIPENVKKFKSDD